MGHGYIVWDVMLCRWVSGTLHFKGSWCLHLQWLCTPRRTNIEGVIMQTFLGCPLSEPKLTQHWWWITTLCRKYNRNFKL